MNNKLIIWVFGIWMFIFSSSAILGLNGFRIDLMFQFVKIATIPLLISTTIIVFKGISGDYVINT